METKEEYIARKSEEAKALFCKGYNCAQAVFSVFADEDVVDKETALRISSPFGGGMGRLREVCGAVSGMFLSLGIQIGYSDPKDQTAKRDLYAAEQSLAEEFREKYGSIICRELLDPESAKSMTPVPEERTKKYYKKRPCAEIVAGAAEIYAARIYDKKEKM